ncbi:DUF6056 family protein [Algoriphagus yeomjeoni]|uniref:Dolichyl-phosphate-mannose-protein mannosyltransferase n=1 Tax=Algoriphagus yeomjeoni TaxID=291403 RepID=A0A327P3X2_9BACT|nr:DUF6056 family protein [Algoriphagus yeomjeoni]RAI85582.1 hypothetical protein LV83_03662 [Algoriphagus yeomjeoni]
MNLNISIITKSFISLLVLIGVVLFLATAFNSFYWMDDFWLRDEILNNGLFHVQWNFYWNWDGRAISPLYTDRLLILWIIDYPFAWLATIGSMTFLFGTAYLLLKILVLDKWNTITIFQKLIFTFLTMFVLILVFRPHLSRTIYWATGSLYSHANFFSIYLLYRLFKTPNSSWNFLWIFIAISSGPNNGIMLLAFLFLGFFLKTFKIESKYFWLYLGFGLITLALVIIAPGNFTRANGQLDFSISSMIAGGIAILKEYSGMSLWLLPGSILMALVLKPFIPKSSLYLPVLFGICAVCSILPFLPMPNAASKHTVIFFQTFLLIAGVQFWAILLDYLRVHRMQGLANTVLTVFLLFFGMEIYKQWTIGRIVKAQMDERFEILESNRGSDKELILAPIPLSDDNWTSRFSDIDPNFESNIYFEKYFQIKKVKISESK